jgi:hypothetical protein
MSLPELKELQPNCETVEFGRNVYVCDPAKPLAKGRRAAVWGVVERPQGGELRRIATSGIYKPRPNDAAPRASSGWPTGVGQSGAGKKPHIPVRPTWRLG